MGSLKLPPTGNIYVDSDILINTVESFASYEPLLRLLWENVRSGQVGVLTSDLSLMETLTGPLKRKDSGIYNLYEQFLQQPGIQMVPISRDILKEAARLRAALPSVRTPDAIHAATATHIGCGMFPTNDTGFRRIPNLPVTILEESTRA